VVKASVCVSSLHTDVTATRLEISLLLCGTINGLSFNLMRLCAHFLF
jgi:hypothetical protein